MKFPGSITIISDEISQDLSEVVRFAKEFRLPGIELRSAFGRAFKDLTPEDIAAVRRAADDEGWRIFGCASPVFKCDLGDAAAVEADIEIFKRSVAVARELKCDLVRVFTFLRRPGDERGERIPRIAAQLERLGKIAADAQVRIGVENEHSCAVATGEELAMLFAKLPGSRFGIVWDPCNMLYLPHPRVAVADSFAALAPRIFHIHVKDAVRGRASASGSHAVAMPVGVGDVGWREHLSVIRRSGYRGMLSLETHWRVEQLAEEVLHLPAGHAFSHGGGEASRACLRNLQALFALAT
ncbi:MAG TPA: sugar phosphate isomerase/epimerase family protein [Opitutaceae bacterium]|nr:sugar phosphate isomerase/epimerase family protein [Opitutaceae bacterium]